MEGRNSLYIDFLRCECGVITHRKKNIYFSCLSTSPTAEICLSRLSKRMKGKIKLRTIRKGLR